MPENDFLDFYVDIETTDTAHSAGIWEIGVVIYWLGQPHGSFYLQCLPDGTVSEATMDWIAGKPDVHERFHQALESSKTQLSALREVCVAMDALRELRAANDRERIRVFTWGSFDVPILTHHMERANIPTPWHYRSEVDLRSVAKFHGLRTRPDTSAHHALDDAKALRACHKELLQLLKGES